jgi:hypothetical protein
MSSHNCSHDDVIGRRRWMPEIADPTWLEGDSVCLKSPITTSTSVMLPCRLTTRYHETTTGDYDDQLDGTVISCGPVQLMGLSNFCGWSYF